MMTKIKFLLELSEKLSGLPQQDIEERLMFYSEMIEDRMEEGFSEEDAVAAIGSVEDVIAQILAQSKPEKKEKKKRELKNLRSSISNYSIDMKYLLLKGRWS